jgi:hypothetical protein
MKRPISVLVGLVLLASANVASAKAKTLFCNTTYSVLPTSGGVNEVALTPVKLALVKDGSDQYAGDVEQTAGEGRFKIEIAATQDFRLLGRKIDYLNIQITDLKTNHQASNYIHWMKHPQTKSIDEASVQLEVNASWADPKQSALIVAVSCEIK